MSPTMTKKLLFLLCVFVSTLGAAQTLIPDPNFEQFLVDEGIDTNGITGDILNADAQAVTALDVTRNDITDFTGLEAFVNLVTLDAGGSQFTTLPLTSLTVLEELEFAPNSVLVSLDVSQNPQLRILDMRSDGSGAPPNPPMTDLDLSTNTNLEVLYIYNFRDLVNLSLPQTNTLQSVSIIAISVPIFDFTNHGGLESILLNQNSGTTDIILPAVRTVLKSLDIRQAVNTIDLSGFIALEELNLSNTNVSSLTLPMTATLKEIDISSHQLPSGFSFANAPGLEDLSITYNRLLTPFTIDITANTLLKDLTVRSNKMPTLDITQNTLLEELNGSDNTLTTIDTSQNTLMTDLEASQNQITNLDLSTNIVLDRIDLRLNLLPELILTNNVALERLDLGENRLPNLDITTNLLLRQLEIDNNLFTTTGLDLTQSANLRDLTASFNQIESLDISQNFKLEELVIDNNLFSGNDILNQYYQNFIDSGRLIVWHHKLIVHHNSLTGEIPNYKSIVKDTDTAFDTYWFQLEIEGNNFHFGDFEAVHDQYVFYRDNSSAQYNTLNYFKTYNYAGQAKVNAIENPNRNAGESITLTTTVRGTQNHYKWFKDGVEIPDAPDAPEYTITDLNTCDAGVYHSEIVSDLVPFEDANPPGTNGRNLLLVRNDITLTVNATKDCVDLAAPTANGATNVPINTGIVWEDNPGACGYKITIRDLDAGTTLVNNEDVGEVTVYNYTSDFPLNTNIGVTITPYFDDGDFGGCTEQSFMTNTSEVAPDCTTLQNPENGNTAVAVAISTITWNPANGADAYKVSIVSTSGSNDLALTDLGNTTSYTLPESFQNNDVVTVTIIPYNTVGDAIGPCTSETFTIIGGTSSEPGCTNLSAPGPVDTDTDVAVDVASISWNAVPNADGYRLTIDGSTSDLNDETALVVTGTTHAFANDFDNGETVTVTIVPFNGTGDASGCTAETFTIVAAGTAPDCTNLSAPGPVDTDTDVAVDVAGISWNPVANADGYRLIINGSTSTGNNQTALVVTSTTHAFTNNFDNGETVTVIIIPFNGIGDASSCTAETFTIVAAGTEPGCTNLSAPGPVDTDTDVAVDVAGISWNAVPNADGYRLTIDGSTSDLNDETALVVTGTTHAFANDFDNGETVTVTIVPFNGTGDASGCTAETFTIVAAGTAPDCTNLSAPGPVDTDTDVAVDVAGISWNPVANADGYRLIINGSTSTGNNQTALVVTSTTHAFTNNFDNGETVTIIIIPFNGIGDASSCTAETFTIVAAGTEPGCTNLSAPGPVDTDTDVAVDVASISWNSVANADGYRLTIDGSTSDLNDETALVVTGTTHAFANDFDNGETVTVTIVPYNATNDATGCLSETFTIVAAGSAPSCTNLSTPGAMDTNVDSDIEEISWDAVAGATGYYLSIAGSTSTGNNVTDLEVIGTSYTLPDLFDEGETVTVTIVPFNADGTASSCASQSFTIRTAAPIPACTNLSTPMNLDTDVIPTLAEITWNTVADAEGYRLTISGSGSTANNITGVAVTETSYPFANAFEEGETVTVLIVPFNASNDAIDCSSETFTIGTEVPISIECTTLSIPANGGSNIAIDTNLAWEAAAGADGYRISIGTTSGGSEILNEEDVAFLTNYDLSGDLPYNTTIYVNITPYNSQGDALNCEEQTFTTVAEEIPEDLTKYGFSPDGDGINEFWEIMNIEQYPDNVVTIFNRWGDVVFQINGYDNSSNVFNGEANQLTGMGADKLPAGTYFFNIQINGDHNLSKTKGYLVLKR